MQVWSRTKNGHKPREIRQSFLIDHQSTGAARAYSEFVAELSCIDAILPSSNLFFRSFCMNQPAQRLNDVISDEDTSRTQNPHFNAIVNCRLCRRYMVSGAGGSATVGSLGLSACAIGASGRCASKPQRPAAKVDMKHAIHGVSVVEIGSTGEQWSYKAYSAFYREITTVIVVALHGRDWQPRKVHQPLAGQRRLRRRSASALSHHRDHENRRWRDRQLNKH